MAKITATDPRVLMREGTMGKIPWREYQVVLDRSVAIVTMAPAGFAGCWNFQRCTMQGEADWPRMTRDQIVAWKLANDDGRTIEVIPPNDGLPLDHGFRGRLLAYVANPVTKER